MNRTAVYVSLGWLRTLAMVIAGFVTSPHLIGTLESALYGAWIFIQDLAAFSDLLYLGIGRYVTRHVARLNAIGDALSLRKLFSQTLFLYTSIGLLAATLLSFWGPLGVAGLATPQFETGVQLTVVLVAANVMLCFVCAACNGLLAGHSKFASLHLMAIGHIALRATLILFLFRGGDSLARLAGLVLAAQVAYLVGIFGVIFLTLPHIRPSFTIPSRVFLKEAYSFGVIAFFVTIYLKVVQLSDTLIVGLMLGAEQLAKFSIPQQMIGYFGVLTVSIVQVLYPKFAGLDWDEDRTEIRHLHLSSISISGIVLGLAAAGVISFAKPFITVWIDADYAGFAAGVIVPMTLYSLVRAIFVQFPVNMLLAYNRAGIAVLWVLCEVIVKLLASTLCLVWFGIVEMCYATLATAIIFDAGLVSYSVFTRLGVSVSTLCFSVAPCVLMLPVSWLIFCFSQQLFGSGNYVSIFMSAGAGTVLAGIAGLAVHAAFVRLGNRTGLIPSTAS